VPLGCEKILVVEDEPEVRSFVTKQLGTLGYSVIEAANGGAALDALASQPDIDLLFSDLILPGGMTGLQLLERARSLRPDLRAVLTTGYTEEFASFESLITDPVLKKPYKRQRLAETLRKALDLPARGPLPQP
jgi:CheY-like chemotaxis protein